ncbi:MAG: hypothetical protein IPJ65_22135 [Archangiaceae bacterium]|nr:hypothetical protein [Archangiaceae bacterium]
MSTSEPHHPDWLIELRAKALALGELPDASARKAGKLFLAVVGAMLLGVQASDPHERERQLDSARRLFRVAADTLMSAMQSQTAALSELRQLHEGLLEARAALRTAAPK